MIIAVAIQWDLQRILTLTSGLFHPNEGGRFQQVGGTFAYSSTSPGKFHHTFHPASGDPSVQKAKLECGDGLAINYGDGVNHIKFRTLQPQNALHVDKLVPWLCKDRTR